MALIITRLEAAAIGGRRSSRFTTGTLWRDNIKV